MQEEKQEKEKLLQTIRNRLQYLIDTRHGGKKVGMARLLNIGSGQVNDWFNVDKHTKPGPKHEPLILEKYSITRAWLYGEDVLNKFEIEEAPKYAKRQEPHPENNLREQTAVYGVITKTVDEYIQLEKKVSRLEAFAEVNQSIIADKGHQIDSLTQTYRESIDKLTETFRDSIHIINSIATGKQPNKRIETEIGKRLKAGAEP